MLPAWPALVLVVDQACRERERETAAAAGRWSISRRGCFGYWSIKTAPTCSFNLYHQESCSPLHTHTRGRSLAPFTYTHSHASYATYHHNAACIQIRTPFVLSLSLIRRVLSLSHLTRYTLAFCVRACARSVLITRWLLLFYVADVKSHPRCRFPTPPRTPASTMRTRYLQSVLQH